MNTITFPYTCKFCGKPGTVTAEDIQFIPGKSLCDPLKYIPMLCCDRCYQYERKRRDLIFHTSRQATKLVTVRILRPDEDDPDRQQLENLIRKSLVRLTKSFGTLVADFWHKLNMWEPDLVDSIMREPGRTHHLLIAYLRAIKRTTPH